MLYMLLVNLQNNAFPLCVYLDVYVVCLSGTKQFTASVATLVCCPVPCHLDLWQGQPKD